MEKKNRIVILTAVLIIFAVSLLSMIIRIKSRMDKYRQRGQRVSPHLIPPDSTSPPDLETIFVRMAVVRDPFVLGSLEKEIAHIDEKESILELTAIVWDEKKPLVIINNKMVGVGDIISSYKITEIQKSKVKLIRDNEIYELELNQY